MFDESLIHLSSRKSSIYFDVKGGGKLHIIARSNSSLQLLAGIFVIESKARKIEGGEIRQKLGD